MHEYCYVCKTVNPLWIARAYLIGHWKKLHSKVSQGGARKEIPNTKEFFVLLGVFWIQLSNEIAKQEAVGLKVNTFFAFVSFKTF